MKGNFVDAKNRLRECLILQPNHTLKGYFYLNKNNNFRKGYALNNLAVASWWHKSPNYREQSDGDDSQNEVRFNLKIIKKIKIFSLYMKIILQN